MMKKTVVLFTLITAASLLFSCQRSAKDDLKDAQLCLNTSAPAEARNCLTKIASDTSATAYKLRCAAVFISEGFNTPASFTDALDKLKNPGTCTGGCSSTVTAINTLNFHNGSNLSTDAAARQRNLDISAEAFDNCGQAGANIYMQISSLFRLGTLASMTAYQTSGGVPPTEDQIKTAIGSLSDADLGAIAVATYTATCTNLTNASDSTKAYCTELGVAVNSSTNQTAVGSCFKNKLQNPNYVCP